MVQSNKIKPLRNLSNSLLSMCIKCVGINIALYENDDCFIRLPKHLKVKIIRFTTRCLQKIHLPSIQILLNEQITTLNLVSFDISDSLLQSISDKCPTLNTLYFRGNSKDLSIEGISQIPKLKYLEKLEIFSCRLIDDEFIKKLTNSCIMLHHLSIPGSQISDESFLFLQKLDLKNLNISKTKISDKFLKNISQSEFGKNLEELSVSNNSNVTNKGLSYLPWKTLKYVAFVGCNTDETLFNTIRPTSKFMMWSIPS